jgi:hypothetical protein
MAKRRGSNLAEWVVFLAPAAALALAAALLALLGR